MLRATSFLPALGGLALCTVGAWGPILPVAVAATATFRCEAGGQVTYGDRPCPVGQPERVLREAPDVSPADRAAARDRARSDQRALAALEHERLAQQRIDRDAARRVERRAAERDRLTRSCTKLALRARRAHDDREQALPRDWTKRTMAARRADDDFAALCRSRAG